MSDKMSARDRARTKLWLERKKASKKRLAARSASSPKTAEILLKRMRAGSKLTCHRNDANGRKVWLLKDETGWGHAARTLLSRNLIRLNYMGWGMSEAEVIKD